MNALLLLVAGSLPQSTLPLPQSTLPPLVAAKPAPQPVRVAPAVRATYPAGWHEHQCSCGNRWGGTGGDHGHTCSRCGRYVNQHADGPFRLPPPQPKQIRIVPRVSLPTSGPDCPT